MNTRTRPSGPNYFIGDLPSGEPAAGEEMPDEIPLRALARVPPAASVLPDASSPGPLELSAQERELVKLRRDIVELLAHQLLEVWQNS